MQEDAIKRAVSRCAETVGFLSLTACTFRRRAARFVRGETLSQCEMAELISDIRYWGGR